MKIKVLLVDDCPEMVSSSLMENKLFNMLFDAITRNATEHSEESEKELWNTLQYIWSEKFQEAKEVK